MTQDFQRAYYEAESFWEGEALQDLGNKLRVERTVRLVPGETQTLLDAGCGNGVFGAALLTARPEITVFGVDRSEAALKHVKFPSKRATLESLPFPDRSFDAVSCLQVIEHIPNDSYGLVLAELARVSQKYLIIGVPYQEDLQKECTRCPQCRTIFNINLHLRSYKNETLRVLLQDHGFSLIQCEFPASKERKKYINELTMALKRRTVATPAFLSPICPVCGYTEGDKTPLNQGPVKRNDVHPAPQRRTLLRYCLKYISKVFPTEFVKGYWVIALYQRDQLESVKVKP